MASTSFLSAEQLSGYGRYGPGLLDREVLDRFFFLDDADREVVAKRRGDHNRLGYALQLLTVRYLGAFLSDVTIVPIEIVHVAAQLGVADPGYSRHTCDFRS